MTGTRARNRGVGVRFAGCSVPMLCACNRSSCSCEAASTGQRNAKPNHNQPVVCDCCTGTQVRAARLHDRLDGSFRRRQIDVAGRAGKQEDGRADRRGDLGQRRALRFQDVPAHRRLRRTVRFALPYHDCSRGVFVCACCVCVRRNWWKQGFWSAAAAAAAAVQWQWL